MGLGVVETLDGLEISPHQTRSVRTILARVHDLDAAIAQCRRFDVAVQAGGHVGIWPRYLGERFCAVYTFEPAPENFASLVRNCPESHIVKRQAALGSRRDRVGLAYEPDRHGRRVLSRGYVNGSGAIDTVRVDDLDLERCDLMQLDIEGYEAEAVQGAWQTIIKHRPVLMIEDKGHSARYGTAAGWPAAMLAPLGYAEVARVECDTILVAQ